MGEARAECGERYSRYCGKGVHLPLPSARQCLAYQMDSSDCAYTSPYERIDSLKIGAGYEAHPRKRRVGLRQPRHHDCPKDSLQACVIHAMVAEDMRRAYTASILRTVTDNTYRTADVH